MQHRSQRIACFLCVCLGVIAIEPEWIPIFVPRLCTFSKPLEDPPPRYDPEVGMVKCHMTCLFGLRAWQIPAQEMEYPPGLDRYRWFSRFLLEGKVFPEFAKFTPFLLTSPVAMTRSWAKLQPRTDVFLSELVSENADSKMALQATWNKNATFLLAAFKQWVPQSMYGELSLMWPPKDCSS